MPEKKTSKLIWVSRILAMLGAIAAIIGATKFLGEYVTQFAGLGAVIFYEISRRVEQWLPQRAGASDGKPEKIRAPLPIPDPPPPKPRPEEDEDDSDQ